MIVAFAAGCGTTSPAEEAGRIFASATSALTDLHREVFEGGRAPERATWDCDVGEIEFRRDESSGTVLEHRFTECSLDGRVYDGILTYFDIEECDPGFMVDIEGELRIEGSVHFERCRFDAREHCDASFSGRVCGMSLAETGFDDVH